MHPWCDLCARELTLSLVTGNFQLIGVPPDYMLDEVLLARRAAGLDPVSCLEACVTVTKQFEYVKENTVLRNRIKPKMLSFATIPVRNRPLAEMLNPQPRCHYTVSARVPCIPLRRA